MGRRDGKVPDYQIRQCHDIERAARRRDVQQRVAGED